ncbi:deltamethrin resistance domain-containing protein [Phthorimaea operculella]|nr:deltamethrin resistance domain-containing protein [Phthorimaea operculella]
MNVSRQASRVLQKAVRRYGHDSHSHFKPATMDELPVPKGSWQAAYDARNRRYNMVLLTGIAFTVASIAVAKASGLVYLNYYPPKSID